MEGNVITKAELLEFSFVPVPANPYALRLNELGKNVADFVTKGLMLKEIVPAIETPKADEGMEWDAVKAEQNIRAWASSDGSGDTDKMDWEKYAKGFTWYDKDAADSFGSYKLPHHDIVDGELVVVWRGVAAAMSVVLGGRGGTNIPDGELQGVYDHLVVHYKQFEKDAPEFKIEPSEEEGEESDDVKANKDATPAVGAELQMMQDEIAQVVTNHAKKVLDILAADEQGEPDESGDQNKGMSQKSGRVLSKKNRVLIQAAIEPMKASIAALEELLEATDPEGDESQKAQDGGGANKRSKCVESSEQKLFSEWLSNREILRAVNNATSEALAKYNRASKSK
jgi:hypothetical protein